MSSQSKKFSKKTMTAFTLLAGLFLVASLVPNAAALEVNLVSTVEVDANKPIVIMEPDDAASPLGQSYAMISGAIFASDLALVSAVSRQVELARTAMGAKKVAKSILLDEYGFGEKEYKCLDSLWTRESHWNYKARNKKSGAHGIAQALPAVKMNVVSTDWRTNPVTQIRWGLRYIDLRYETPCKALAKHKRSRYY